MVSVEDVQSVETMWLSPRNPNRMESSLASVPMVPVGKRVHAALVLPVQGSREAELAADAAASADDVSQMG
jgi:hypothetical protein